MTLGWFLRALRREVRSSWRRFAFFVSCLAVGVAAVTGVAALASSVGDSFRSRSRELLGADLEISGRRPVPTDLAVFRAELKRERTDVREFPTMARSTTANGEPRTRLVDLRVLSGRYPLYGALQLDRPGTPESLLTAETVLVSPELASELAVSVGDDIYLGGQPFRIVGVVTGDTEGIDFSLFLGPRLFIADSGVERASLLGAGSRVRYRALFRFPELTSLDELETLKAQVVRNLPNASYYRVETYTEGQPGIQDALDRLSQYLGLVALLSLLLGGIGTAQVIRTWIASKVPAIAVQRCLGLRPRDVLFLYLGQVAFLALVGSLVGAAIGSAFPLLLAWWGESLLGTTELAVLQVGAIVRGVALGVGVAILFGLPALTAVWRVPPLRVLRADVDVLPPSLWLRIGLTTILIVGVFLTAWAQSRDPMIALAFTGALGAVTGALWLGARAFLALVSRIPRSRLSPHFKQGVAALVRPGGGTTGTIVALGLGIAVVFTVQLVRMRLEEELTATLPAGAPSAYVWDIQPPQWDGVRTLLEQQGAETIQGVPVVNCRLQAIDGKTVQELIAERGDEVPRARWLFTREQRITWLPELPSDNRIVAGELWSDPQRPELSIEVDFAEDLGIGVGSVITFDIQGIPMDLAVTSLREVSWRSFGINFFLLAEPEVLAEAPHFVMAGIRMTADQEQATQDLLTEVYPNTTLIRVRPILEKVTALLDRIILAVAALGSFTVLTGLVILAGAVSATQLRRSREAALLKAVGMTRGGVVGLFCVEYALLGAVAGAIGGAASFGLAALFLRQMLDVPAQLPLWLAGVIPFGSALLACASGLAASSGALRTRPLEVLRRAE